MSAPSPAKGPPHRTVLYGRYARLEPIGRQHLADLYRASRDGDAAQRFTYLFGHQPQSEAELAAEIDKAAALDDPLTFAVIDTATNAAEGRQSLMRIVPEHGVIEVGGIYWGPRLARTRAATEALYLHARYAFDTLGYRRLEWKCNNLNEPSKAAARRFGFTFEGVFRQHMIVKGQSRDSAWFSILDSEWPRLKAEYERWLDPSNFGPDGLQRTRLRFGARVGAPHS
ncbi:MAG TPA: GNAT family protein [Devosia sp.]|nr:GNAT family protein [Devosia sp.]